MFFLQTYYLIKPLIPRRLQIALRRALVRRRLKKCQDIWPIDERAGEPPEGWPGWPEGKKFALVLTHDVESRRGLERVLPLARLEQKLGFRSCFNFVGRDYPVYDQIRKTLTDMGFEVGLHGLTHKGNLFRSRRVFDKQKSEINRILREWGAKGFRTPSMYHNLEWIGELDIEYDMSTFDTDPFEPQPDGVRTIFPFWVPSSYRQNRPNDSTDQIDRRDQKGFVELPNTLPQDHTLFILMREKGIEIWKRKLDWIAEKGGMALLNVHPDYSDLDSFNTNDLEYPINYYENFLSHLKQNWKGRYWLALPSEIGSFIRKTMIPRQVVGKSPLEKIRIQKGNSEKKQEKRRVSFIYYAWFNASAVLYREAKALLDKGFQVDIICLREEKKYPKYWRFEGLNIYGIQVRPGREKNNFLYFSRLALFCLKSMFLLSVWGVTKKYRLIHVTTPPDFLVFAGIVPKLLGAKIIMDIHDIGPELYMRKLNVPEGSRLVRFLKWMERLSAQFADHVITVTDLWREKLINRSVDPSSCTVLMNVPDDNLFPSPPVARRINQREHLNLFYHGSLEEHFGVDTLIKALPEIRKRIPNVRLHIYGGGRLLENLIDLTQRLGVNDCACFKGSVPFFKLPEILAEAEIGVVPTKDSIFSDEALSMKSLEYLSLGIPVVISNTAAHRYYYTDDMVAFFKAGCEKDLARAVIALSRKTPLELDGLYSNVRTFFSKHGWEQARNTYYQIVDSLLEKKKM